MLLDDLFSKDNFILHIYDADDAVAREFVVKLITEGGKEYDLGKGRRMIFHRASVPNTQDHLHFYAKKNHLYALNLNGTAHDQSHGREMHRWAMDAVKDKYPHFTLPPDGLIESMMHSDVLVEAFDGEQTLIPEEDLRMAVNIAALAKPN